MDYLSTGTKMRLAAIALLILPAAFTLSWNLKAHAGELSGSSNTCVDNGVHPSPYSGGAGVSRVFYPADGSTVTVTTTGAVIKQSPCGTPYREGWVNTADMSCVNTFSDLSGRMASGASNPYVNSNSTCANQTSTTTAKPVTTTTTTTSAPVVANTQTASTPQTVATYTTNAGKSTVLPNTGPGDVLALGGISSVLGGVGHYIFRARRFR